MIHKIKQLLKARSQREELIAHLTEENLKFKEQNSKIVASHNKLRKVVQGMIKDIKPELKGVKDEAIIASWNSGIPTESATNDIMVALRGSRKVMNSINMQGLQELNNILDEGKKEYKTRYEEIRDEKYQQAELDKKNKQPKLIGEE